MEVSDLVLPKLIEKGLRKAILTAFPDADPGCIQLQVCTNRKFGDYQCTSVMAIAKRLKANPRECAQKVMDLLDLSSIAQEIQLAGPGFINIRLRQDALKGALLQAIRTENHFVEKTQDKRNYVVDFSSPNVAKPMHVGHIRSTILGDCLAKILRFLGHHAITDNHIGDWGTQFGKLLVGWKHYLQQDSLQKDALGELERLYREVNKACEEDPEILASARNELVKLQQGDEENIRIWKEMLDLSRTQFDTVYTRLGIHFDHTLGESFYNNRLKDVVGELTEQQIATDSQGAKVVFFENVDGLKDHPALILKRDGAANYTTTDLATLEYRIQTWSPDEIIYVTDGRQQLHFKQLFEIFSRWQPGNPLRLVHTWFGSILGPDGKPFKTRSGETIKLNDLLDEAEDRAYRAVREKNTDLDPSESREIARVVGIGAVKYADLLPNRQTDYVFDWDKLLSLSGNTAPYLQYACTRIRSIFRKAGIEEKPFIESIRTNKDFKLEFESEHEQGLARHMINFGLVLESVMEDHRPNYLCNYLFELAGHYTSFYENCPVLKSEGDQRQSRLVLCLLTRQVLEKGLSLLGIETPKMM
jgi:arginyl-tRNA synthetase